MAIRTYEQYRALPVISAPYAGDIFLKKAFRETYHGVVEWGITTGQKMFAGDDTVKVGGLFSREKFKVAINGSNTSEHAAVAIGGGELAEAVGEGVITASLSSRRHERYCVYRCSNTALRDSAVVIAKGLSNAYHNVITNSPEIRNTTGGSYALGQAIASNVRGKVFQQGATADYLSRIIDYVHGLRNDRPNMFCSEFAAACYEAGSVAAFGKTAFGSNPRAMSPMVLEDLLNGRPDVMTLVGRYDSEDDKLFSAVMAALKKYGSKWKWNQSKESKKANEILHNLLQIGDNEYLLAALAALLNMEPTTRSTVRCQIDPKDRLNPESSLYGFLKAELQPTGMFSFR